MNPDRLSRLYELMRADGLTAVILNPGPTLTYLTGLQFHLMERPTLVIFAPPAVPVIVLPELESGKLSQSLFKLRAFTYGENPAKWGDAILAACQEINLNGKTVVVEPLRLRFMELQYLQDAAPRAIFISGEATLNSLRIQKDQNEVDAMRKAVKIAEQGFLGMLERAKSGMTERELAAELSLAMLQAGSEPELPFSPIIASGQNSANPHAVPTDRKLSPGDLVVVDWGATYEGYFSDLTRTLAIDEVDPELIHIASVVAEANGAGRAAAKPGVLAGSVDDAARVVITSAGYGDYFTHRTGHGLGMETHEQPYIFNENILPLAEGMTFTVEPGIYLPGRGGVRIEDNMVVTSTGAETLSSLPRELYRIG
ncbi:MAG TPA: Xaa-Pro peptidase family protein [Longilinea sp.]|nr:Xaa-Pro peptidase family protein [Longilinea sp.]